jgi:hypothetical protein
MEIMLPGETSIPSELEGNVYFSTTLPLAALVSEPLLSSWRTPGTSFCKNEKLHSVIGAMPLMVCQILSRCASRKHAVTSTARTS